MDTGGLADQASADGPLQNDSSPGGQISVFPESPEVTTDCSLTLRRALSCQMQGSDRLIPQPESATIISTLLLLLGSLSLAIAGIPGQFKG